MRLFLRSCTLFLLLVLPACSNNYLESFATKTDDDSLLWAAQSALWTNDYPTAIAACNSMSSNGIAKDNVAIVCASAYAGRCGYSLNFMTTNLTTLTPPIFLAELHIFNTVQTNQQVSDCETAETILQGIGTAARRSQDANMAMALVTIYEMGVISSNLASNGSGAVTGGYDPCGMSVANQQALGVAFYDLYQSLLNLSSVALVSTVATAVGAQCTALNALGYDLCNLNNLVVGTSGGQFNPLNLTASARLGAMSNLVEGFAFGLNTGTGGNACGGQPVSQAHCHC